MIRGWHGRDNHAALRHAGPAAGGGIVGFPMHPNHGPPPLIRKVNAQQMIEFGHGTHPGIARLRNEDTYYADPALGLFLVLDGMGGHRHGELASAIARDGIVERVTRGQSLIAALEATNEQLRALAHARPMGSTVAAVRIAENQWEAVWVGDTRLYVDDGGLRRLEHDRKLAEKLKENGEWPETRPTEAPRSAITQALGVTGQDQLYAQMARGTWKPGMHILLCTDGLTETIDDTRLAEVTRRGELGAQECVDHLLLDALDKGARDNLTAILLRHA
jgi:serine/threonine protein phosphatase PrpC